MIQPFCDTPFFAALSESRAAPRTSLLKWMLLAILVFTLLAFIPAPLTS